MHKNVLERLERIDHLIRIKGTGTPADLANRLHISQRSVYQYLNLMREMGAPIKFCPFRETYYYIEEGQFMARFKSAQEELLNNKYAKAS